MLEDIKPITKRSQRNLAERLEKQPVKKTLPPLPREVPFEPSEPRHAGRHGLWWIAGVCLVALLFSLSFLFERATVRITPKSLPVAFDAGDTFTAAKDSTDEGVIVYTVMTLSGDESMKLPSTSSKQQSIPATGRVILYNAYGTAPYKLVKNTRLAAPDGKIFRLDSAVTIPGYTKSGGTIVPGSVQVAVTAAEPGDAYNIGPSDFMVPGLSGTPQYSKIYARSADAMKGGMTGLVYSIPQDAANAALGTLREKLKTSLYQKAQVQVPNGYVFYEGATVFKTEDAVQVPYSLTAEVPIALHGTLTAYLLKEDTLVAAIADKEISQDDGEPVTIPDIESLAIVPAGTIAPGSDATFSFTVSGSAKIVWVVDTELVQKALAGAKKSLFSQVLAEVRGVDQAEMVLKPFWKRSFPKDPARITVEAVAP